MAGLTLEEAFLKFGPELVRHAAVVAGPAHAEDVVSEAIVGALRSPRFASADNQLAYLHVSVRNAARMWHRGRLRTSRREWRVSQWADAGRFEYLGRPDVVAAVRSLSVQQRSVVYFTYWEDLTPSAVAEVLGVSEGSVKKQLARAREQLRSVLDA